MAHTELIENVQGAAVSLNGNVRGVIDIWLNGITVWPLEVEQSPFRVSTSEVRLDASNGYKATIEIYAPDDWEWIFE